MHGDSLEGMGCGDGGELWSPLSAHTWREWVWPWQSLLAHTLGSATEMHSSWMLSLRWTGSGQEHAVISRQNSLTLPTPHHSLEPDLGKTGPGRGLHRCSPDPRQQHSHLDSCSNSAPALSARLLHTIA